MRRNFMKIRENDCICAESQITLLFTHTHRHTDIQHILFIVSILFLIKCRPTITFISAHSSSHHVSITVNMFALVVLLCSSCFAVEHQHLKLSSFKVSEDDFSSYFSRSFDTRSRLQCTTQCRKEEESLTIFFSPDPRLCSCHSYYLKPVAINEGLSVDMIQDKIETGEYSRQTSLQHSKYIYLLEYAVPTWSEHVVVQRNTPLLTHQNCGLNVKHSPHKRANHWTIGSRFLLKKTRCTQILE